MLLTRRKFLAGVGAAAVAPLAATHAKDAQVETLVAVYEWHRRTFYDYEQDLTTLERSYVRRVLALNEGTWAHRIARNIELSTVSFSHRITLGPDSAEASVNSSRLAVGSYTHAEHLRPDVEALIRARGVDPRLVPQIGSCIGVGWDLIEKTFKVYCYVPRWDDVSTPALLVLMKRVRAQDYHPFGLSSVSISDGTIVESKAYLAMRARRPPLVSDWPVRKASIVHTNYMVTDRRGVVPQVDLRGGTPVPGFGPTAAALQKAYSKAAGRSLDTVAYRPRSSTTLYF